jgi:hypothetical protein
MLWFSRFDQRQAWNKYREALLSAWIVRFPGSRPAAFFDFDLAHNEWREKTGGSGVLAADVFWDRSRAYHHCDPDDPPAIESQATFLDRLGKLTPDERERVPPAAWEPITLTLDEEGWAWPPAAFDLDRDPEEGWAMPPACYGLEAKA